MPDAIRHSRSPEMSVVFGLRGRRRRSRPALHRPSCGPFLTLPNLTELLLQFGLLGDRQRRGIARPRHIVNGGKNAFNRRPWRRVLRQSNHRHAGATAECKQAAKSGEAPPPVPLNLLLRQLHFHPPSRMSLSEPILYWKNDRAVEQFKFRNCIQARTKGCDAKIQRRQIFAMQRNSLSQRRKSITFVPRYLVSIAL